MKRLAWLTGFALLLAPAALKATAAPRTMISDYTGLDCTINQDAPVYADPDGGAKTVAKLADQTSVHILGGKQFGPFVAIPGTDEEFARTWLKIRMAGGKIAWIRSGAINCGG